MAELADAADSKSAEVHPSWGFNSPSRHQTNSYANNEVSPADSAMLNYSKRIDTPEDCAYDSSVMEDSSTSSPDHVLSAMAIFRPIDP